MKSLPRYILVNFSILRCGTRIDVSKEMELSQQIGIGGETHGEKKVSASRAAAPFFCPVVNKGSSPNTDQLHSATQKPSPGTGGPQAAEHTANCSYCLI